MFMALFTKRRRVIQIYVHLSLNSYKNLKKEMLTGYLICEAVRETLLIKVTVYHNHITSLSSIQSGRFLLPQGFNFSDLL